MVPRGGIEPPTLRFSVLVPVGVGNAVKFPKRKEFQHFVAFSRSALFPECAGTFHEISGTITQDLHIADRPSAMNTLVGSIRLPVLPA
jgi:hypothetical protein